MVVNMAVDLPATEKRYERLVWEHFNSHYIRTYVFWNMYVFEKIYEIGIFPFIDNRRSMNLIIERFTYKNSFVQSISYLIKIREI